MIKLDLSEALSNKPIPEGVYDCVVEDIEGPSSGEKSTYMTWIFRIADGDFEGRKLFHITPIDGKGAGMFIQAWNPIAGTDYDVEELSDLELDESDVIGQTCEVLVGHEEYPEGSGEMKARVQSIYPG